MFKPEISGAADDRERSQVRQGFPENVSWKGDDQAAFPQHGGISRAAWPVPWNYVIIGPIDRRPEKKAELQVQPICGTALAAGYPFA